jgi:hypothetical protein
VAAFGTLHTRGRRSQTHTGRSYAVARCTTMQISQSGSTLEGDPDEFDDNEDHRITR